MNRPDPSVVTPTVLEPTHETSQFGGLLIIWNSVFTGPAYGMAAQVFFDSHHSADDEVLGRCHGIDRRSGGSIFPRTAT